MNEFGILAAHISEAATPGGRPVRIVIASDHAGYEYKERLKLFLIDAAHFVVGMAAVGLVFVLLG